MRVSFAFDEGTKRTHNNLSLWNSPHFLIGVRNQFCSLGLSLSLFPTRCSTRSRVAPLVDFAHHLSSTPLPRFLTTRNISIRTRRRGAPHRREKMNARARSRICIVTNESIAQPPRLHRRPPGGRLEKRTRKERQRCSTKDHT